MKKIKLENEPDTKALAKPCTLHSVMRSHSMHWWNNLSSATKTQICDTNTELLGGIRRWETLNGSEIEKLCAYYA